MRDTNKPQASAILPKGHAPTSEELNPISGLDALLWLDLPNETAFKRALGQLVDSETKRPYHLDDNPPPANTPV